MFQALQLRVVGSMVADGSLIAQDRHQIRAGVRLGVCRHFLGCSRRDHRAAPVAPFGAEIDQVIRGLDDVEIMFDHQDRIAQFHEARKHVEQLVNVGEV